MPKPNKKPPRKPIPDNPPTSNERRVEKSDKSEKEKDG
jgi:hypothetical protein